MRTLCLIAVLFLVTAHARAADPPGPSKARAEAAAALALASSCDCPAGGMKCGKVAEVLAKVSVEIAVERARPAVAPMPREKPAAAPTPDPLPAAFRDAGGCDWTPHRSADGGVCWTRVCPARR